jgi:flagellar hook-associated protein 3 FlgL
MRVTEGSKYAQVIGNLSSLNARYAKASVRAQSGLRVNSPSDDPIAAGELIRNDGALARISAQRDVIRSVRGDTELAESTLGEAADLFARANEIAIQAGNGSLSAQDRQNLATEVAGLKAELVTLGNTRGSRGSIFGGSKTDTAAFDANGVFLGDSTDQVADVGTGGPTVVGASGSRAFTAAGGRDVFADLDALHTALTTNDDTAARAALTGIEASRKQLTDVRAEAGLTLRRLETSDSVLEQADFDTNSRQHNIGAADPAQVYSEFIQLGQSIENSITVSRQILQLSTINRFG